MRQKRWRIQSNIWINALTVRQQPQQQQQQRHVHQVDEQMELTDESLKRINKWEEKRTTWKKLKIREVCLASKRNVRSYAMRLNGKINNIQRSKSLLGLCIASLTFQSLSLSLAFLVVVAGMPCAVCNVYAPYIHLSRHQNNKSYCEMITVTEIN